MWYKPFKRAPKTVEELDRLQNEAAIKVVYAHTKQVNKDAMHHFRDMFLRRTGPPSQQTLHLQPHGDAIVAYDNAGNFCGVVHGLAQMPQLHQGRVAGGDFANGYAPDAQQTQGNGSPLPGIALDLVDAPPDAAVELRDQAIAANPQGPQQRPGSFVGSEDISRRSSVRSHLSSHSTFLDMPTPASYTQAGPAGVLTSANHALRSRPDIVADTRGPTPSGQRNSLQFTRDNEVPQPIPPAAIVTNEEATSSSSNHPVSIQESLGLAAPPEVSATSRAPVVAHPTTTSLPAGVGLGPALPRNTESSPSRAQPNEYQYGEGAPLAIPGRPPRFPSPQRHLTQSFPNPSQDRRTGGNQPGMTRTSNGRAFTTQVNGAVVSQSQQVNYVQETPPLSRNPSRHTNRPSTTNPIEDSNRITLRAWNMRMCELLTGHVRSWSLENTLPGAVAGASIRTTSEIMPPEFLETRSNVLNSLAELYSALEQMDYHTPFRALEGAKEYLQVQCYEMHRPRTLQEQYVFLGLILPGIQVFKHGIMGNSTPLSPTFEQTSHRLSTPRALGGSAEYQVNRESKAHNDNVASGSVQLSNGGVPSSFGPFSPASQAISPALSYADFPQYGHSNRNDVRSYLEYAMSYPSRANLPVQTTTLGGMHSPAASHRISDETPLSRMAVVQPPEPLASRPQDPSGFGGLYVHTCSPIRANVELQHPRPQHGYRRVEFGTPRSIGGRIASLLGLSPRLGSWK